MNADESIATIKKLKRHFDDESVQRALTSLDSGVFDSWMISTLLSGRGATLLYPKIEQRLKQNPTLRNIKILSEYLPRTEIISLLDQNIDINDAEIIDQIRKGKFPHPIPEERRQGIYEALRKVVNTESRSADISTILLFLLDWDRQPGADRYANDESLMLATEWCLNFGDEVKVEPVLSRLLWMRPSQEVLRLAEAHLYNFEWTRDSTFLLTGLMEATRCSQKRRWIEKWFACSDPDDGLDDYVISEWIRTTNCSRRALARGKETIRTNYDGCQPIIRSMTEFLHRKTVHRWIARFIKSNIASQLTRTMISDVLRHSPTKHHCALAKQVMKAADDEGTDDILIELVRYTNDTEVVEMAKQRVQEYPNAPISFGLMSAIASSDSDLAVPWLREWIETALPDQVGDGLATIILASPTPEHLQMAHEWISKMKQEDPSVDSDTYTDLLDVLLKVDPSEASV